VKGVCTDSKPVLDEFFFIVPERFLTTKNHPRLFFTTDDLPGLSPEGKSPRLREIFEKNVTSAKKRLDRADIDAIVEDHDVRLNREYLDGGPFSTTWDDYDRWRNPGTITASAVESGAYLYALTGDREAGLKAKEFMLRLAAFDVWNNHWFEERKMYSYYPVGIWCQSLAVGYDFLYPLMNSEERSLVRKAFMEKAIIPHYVDQVVNNRLPSNITNHIGMNTVGILLAAIALIGEDPENPFMEPYLSGILAMVKAHIDVAYRPDGSYAEPVGYTSTDTEPLVKALDAIERNLGINWTTTTFVKNVYLYPAYLSTRNGRNAPTFGDSNNDWGAGMRRLHLWLAHRNGDRLAWGRYLWQNNNFPGREDFFDYFWMPENLEPRSFSELPTSRWFWSKGDAVFRSGWEGDNLIFVFRCGPHSNHYHIDQGTFWFLYGGEQLITEAGMVNYYENLYYRSFYIQPIAHNTVLLNGYPESQRIADYDNEIKALGTYPKISSCFTGEIMDAVEGDLACVYKDRLDNFKRSFIFVKPDYFVLYDNIASKGKERFTWLFHALGTKSISGNGNEVKIIRPKARLRMDILTPQNLERTTKRYVDQDKSFIQLETQEPATEARFLALMIPSSDENTGEREKWKTNYIKDTGWIGTEVERGRLTDRILFRTEPGWEQATSGDFNTDGDRLVVSKNSDGKIEKLWIRNALILKVIGTSDKRTLIQCDTRATVAVAYNAGEMRIESDTDEMAKLSVWSEKKPNRVLLNGEKTRFSFDNDTGLLTLSVLAGHNSVNVR